MSGSASGQRAGWHARAMKKPTVDELQRNYVKIARIRTAQDRLQDGHLDRMGYRGAQIFETIGVSRSELIDAASPEHRRGSAALDWPRSSTILSAGIVEAFERPAGQTAGSGIRPIPQGRRGACLQPDDGQGAAGSRDLQ